MHWAGSMMHRVVCGCPMQTRNGLLGLEGESPKAAELWMVAHGCPNTSSHRAGLLLRDQREVTRALRLPSQIKLSEDCYFIKTKGSNPS